LQEELPNLKPKENPMGISYKKLWHLLIDKNMTKSDLQRAAKLSWGTLARMNRGENIGTDTLLRICQVMECDFNGILEVTIENAEQKRENNLETAR